MRRCGSFGPLVKISTTEDTEDTEKKTTSFSFPPRPPWWRVSSVHRAARLGLGCFVRLFVGFFERQALFGRRLLDQQRRRLEAESLGHVFDLRQLAQIVQAESNQELFRRRVQERTSDHLFAADDLDHVPLEERIQDARG